MDAPGDTEMKGPIRCSFLSIPLLLVHTLILNAGERTPVQEYADVNLTDGLSASEAVTLALKRSRQLLALRKSRAVAEGGISVAKALPDPELRTGRFDFSDDSAGIWNHNYNLALRWSPPRPGERNLKGSWALGKVSEVDGEIAVAEQKLAAEVRLLHMNIVFLDEQIKLAKASVELREQIVGFITTQVEAGVKSDLDQSVAELALADAYSLPDTYRMDRRIAMNRLTGELDLPPSENLTLQVEGEPLVFQPGPLDTARLIETALARRPELAILSARCSQSEAMLSLRKRERYPWFSFVQMSREFGGGFGSHAWGFRLGIDLPIFKWTRGVVQGPAAEVEQCGLELEAMKRKISLEVEELVERLRSRFGELERYQKIIAPLAGRAVELTNVALAAGQGEMLQRLTAEARRVSGQQIYLSKLLNYRRLEIELDQALGNAVGQ
jgi:outer membrane protein TolC